MSALGLFVRATGRSWWQALYRDGRIVSEWDTIAGLFAGMLPRDYAELGPRSRWEDLDLTRVVAVRLLCPDGQAAELRAGRGSALFQLKSGRILAGPGQRPQCAAHLIGAADGDEGACQCYAWEVAERRLVAFRDNVFRMEYRGIGQLGVENLRLKV